MKKAIKSGTMPMFNPWHNFLNLLPSEALASSFFIKRTNNTRTPISAKEPAIAEVVTDVMVDVVTVEIIVPPY